MILVSKSSPAEKPEVLVRRPCVTIDAAVFTPAIRVEAYLEADVRAVVLGDDALRPVRQILRRRPAEALEILVVPLDLLEIELAMGRLEPVGRVDPRATAVGDVRLTHRILTLLGAFFTDQADTAPRESTIHKNSTLGEIGFRRIGLLKPVTEGWDQSTFFVLVRGEWRSRNGNPPVLSCNFSSVPEPLTLTVGLFGLVPARVSKRRRAVRLPA